jgi:hypothetical protein
MQIHKILPGLTRQAKLVCILSHGRDTQYSKHLPHRPFSWQFNKLYISECLLLADNKMHGRYFAAVCIAIAAISCIASADESISSMSRYINIGCIAAH